MQLILIRHGIAVDRDDPQCPPDPKRPLTPKGRERVEAMARLLKGLKVNPEVWISSPYLRARETALIFMKRFGVEADTLVINRALLPESHPQLIFETLELLGGAPVILFGHAPHLDLALARALRLDHAVTQLKKAGAAALEVEFGPLRASLAWLLPPAVATRLPKKSR